MSKSLWASGFMELMPKEVDERFSMHLSRVAKTLKKICVVKDILKQWVVQETYMASISSNLRARWKHVVWKS